MQSVISSECVNEYLLIGVTCLGYLGMFAGDYFSAICHFRGIAAILAFVKKSGRKLDPMVNFAVQTAWKGDTTIALCGYEVSIPNDLVPKDVSWVTGYLGDRKLEKWIKMEMTITRFMQDIAIYKRWAARVRRKNPADCGTEMGIVRRGERLESTINSWASDTIPPYQIMRDDEPDLSRFLGYPGLKFSDSFHAEIHLLWYTSLLLVSSIKYPQTAPLRSDRLTIAILFCQSLAALSEAQGSRAILAITFGLYYAAMAFGDQHIEGDGLIMPCIDKIELSWCRQQYERRPPNHLFVFETLCQRVHEKLKGQLKAEDLYKSDQKCNLIKW